VEQDENVVSLLRARTPVVSIFGKAWDLHVTAILNATLEQNLHAVRDTLSFFKKHGKQVIFDAEHFFDGFMENESYAMQVLSAPGREARTCFAFAIPTAARIPRIFCGFAELSARRSPTLPWAYTAMTIRAVPWRIR
jgi:2-isopropylmalate synthase